MTDLSRKLSSQFTKAELNQYRREWIKAETRLLASEQGLAKSKCKTGAAIAYEEYVGQGGLEARDERILEEREMVREFNESARDEDEQQDFD